MTTNTIDETFHLCYISISRKFDSFHFKTFSTSKQQKAQLVEMKVTEIVYKCVYVRVYVEVQATDQRLNYQAESITTHNRYTAHYLFVAFCNDKTKASCWVSQIGVRLPSSAPVMCRLQVREVSVSWAISSNRRHDLAR